MNLKPYAAHHLNSIGRLYKEIPSPLRNEFQRDRDRIIHSTSFRRLQYETQVFVNHEGDMFRNRLTHSLEVAQISRGIARTLGCHEDLVEAIALSHDLGHTPFGHAGQDALNECMKGFGGFEHNLQSLRVVDFLENRYAEFRGLNLTFETREGILKHCSKHNAKQLGLLGKRFIDKLSPSLEAQIVNIADEIAYCHHDLDDGLRSGVLDFKKLRDLQLFNTSFSDVKLRYENLSSEQLMNESIRRMMFLIINDVCVYSTKMINKFNPQTINDIRNQKELILFSEETKKEVFALKHFSRKFIYNHPRIKKMSEEAKGTIQKLFIYFMKNFEKIPFDYRNDKKYIPERIIADYIAGMTDRFALDLMKEIS